LTDACYPRAAVSDSPPIVLRRGVLADNRPCHDLLMEAVIDLTERQGSRWEADREATWPLFEPVYRLVAEHAAEWWLAEDPSSHQLLGYARSIERGGLFELSELFVRPGRQSSGVGRQLLERAFPAGRGEVRVIVATTDARALSRYYRAGTVARFPIVTLSRAPRADRPAGDRLEIGRASMEDIPALAVLERAVLEFARGTAEFAWLVEQREGYLYRKHDEVAGFGFVGASGTGPIAALDPADLPEILDHIEGRAAAMGKGTIGLEVPMVNEIAVRHLLGQGYQMDPFLTLLLSSRPFGQFDRFIGFGPPLVL
jgi:GNAT superfamily N-acetyltransferase